MENASTPVYNRRVHRGSPNYFKSASPYKSPQDRPFGSPDFHPYNYSSPVKRGSPNYYGPKHQHDRNSRYYGSQSSHSSYEWSNRPSYGNHNRNRQNFRKRDDISIYVDKSMLEDPWAELENQTAAPEQVRESFEPPSESSSIIETEESSILLDSEDPSNNLSDSIAVDLSSVSNLSEGTACTSTDVVLPPD